MVIRISKVLLVAAVAFFATLVAFGNITDYSSNFAFVQHVLRMDTIFPDSSIKYRAITADSAHHAAYVIIIATQVCTAILCWLGAWQLYRHRHAGAREFHRAKRISIVGLTLGFLLWQVGFMSIGGEWFGMWMSEQWNGVPSAFRFFITIAVVLIYVAQRDEELEA